MTKLAPIHKSPIIDVPPVIGGAHEVVCGIIPTLIPNGNAALKMGIATGGSYTEKPCASNKNDRKYINPTTG